MQNQPLPERMRPETLEEYVGQKHILGKGSSLRNFIDAGNIPSMILWGPPGVGKTTLALILSKHLDRQFFTLSAVSSGVKDVRAVIDRAKNSRFFDSPPPVLFIDEIHRFSKSQQDSLLAAVENGTITLVGATTENPSFEVISPLLSRSQVYVLKHLEKGDLISLLHKACKHDTILKKKEIIFKEYDALIMFSGGDARKLLNLFDIVISGEPSNKIEVTNKLVQKHLQQNIAIYDKDGEMHYDIISAFIKSIRGSDPNAAVYWLARMLEGGEDIKFIARRLIISAAEDIGLANPNALLLANNCFDACTVIGMPEARIILSEATIYLATSPKSNSAYNAINEAIATVKKTGNLPVPLNLRNAPTKLMAKLDYGKGYKYSHDYPNSFAYQEFMPRELSNISFYRGKENNAEKKMIEQMKNLWGNKYSF